jgi:hypothetical protein
MAVAWLYVDQAVQDGLHCASTSTEAILSVQGFCFAAAAATQAHHQDPAPGTTQEFNLLCQ